MTMLSAAFVDIGLMLLSAILSTGVPSALTMFVLTVSVPVLAIATVYVIDGKVNKARSGWSNKSLLDAFVQKPKRTKFNTHRHSARVSTVETMITACLEE
jgi:hypothetical protein